MNSLYTLHQLPSSPSALADTLAYLPTGSAIMLYQDAVALCAQTRFASLLSSYRLYVLADDLKARGLTCVLPAALIDYQGFVALTLQHDNVQAW